MVPFRTPGYSVGPVRYAAYPPIRPSMNLRHLLRRSKEGVYGDQVHRPLRKY